MVSVDFVFCNFFFLGRIFSNVKVDIYCVRVRFVQDHARLDQGIFFFLLLVSNFNRLELRCSFAD